MNRGRPRLEPLQADQINERLAYVLADRRPRRARSRDDTEARPAHGWSMAAGSRADPVASDPGESRSTDAESGATLPSLVDELPPLGGVRGVLPAVRQFTATHLKVVAVLVAVGLVITGWELLRARPIAIAEPSAMATLDSPAPPSRSATPPTPDSSASSATVVVHVLGAVRKPGLVSLPDRSRVQDALDAAGGLKPSADPGQLNLAQLVADGEQIMVGDRKHPAGEVRDGSGGSVGNGSGGGSARPEAVVDLNRATAAQLEELPGVGPVTAGKIVAWRDEHHRFNSVNELQEVDGIGPKTLAQIAPHVRV